MGTNENILLNYVNLTRMETILFSSAKLSMALSLALSFPLVLFPCRVCLHTIIRDRLPKCLSGLPARVYFFSETILIVIVAYIIAIEGKSISYLIFTSNHRYYLFIY